MKTKPDYLNNIARRKCSRKELDSDAQIQARNIEREIQYRRDNEECIAELEHRAALIVANYDYAGVARAMELLGKGWFDTTGKPRTVIPTKSRMQAMLTQLLRDVIKAGRPCEVESGGFTVIRDNDGTLKVLYSVVRDERQPRRLK